MIRSKREYEIALAQGQSPQSVIHNLDDALTVLRYTAADPPDLPIPRRGWSIEELLMTAAELAMQADLADPARRREVSSLGHPQPIPYVEYARAVMTGVTYANKEQFSREAAGFYASEHPFMSRYEWRLDVLRHTASLALLVRPFYTAGTEVGIYAFALHAARSAMWEDILGDMRGLAHYRPNLSSKRQYEISLAQGLDPRATLYTVDDALTALRYTSSADETVQIPMTSPFSVAKVLMGAAATAMVADREPARQRGIAGGIYPMKVGYDEYWSEVNRATGLAMAAPNEAAGIEAVERYVQNHPFMGSYWRQVDVLGHTAHIDALGDFQGGWRSLVRDKSITGLVSMAAQNAMLADILSQMSSPVPHYRP